MRRLAAPSALTARTCRDMSRYRTQHSWRGEAKVEILVNWLARGGRRSEHPVFILTYFMFMQMAYGSCAPEIDVHGHRASTAHSSSMAIRTTSSLNLVIITIISSITVIGTARLSNLEIETHQNAHPESPSFLLDFYWFQRGPAAEMTRNPHRDRPIDHLVLNLCSLRLRR